MSYSYLQFCWDTQLFHIIRDYKNHLEIKLFLGNSHTWITASAGQEW